MDISIFLSQKPVIACTSFIIQVKQRGGNLATNLKATVSDIEGDELHLSNVLLNLLENALKYCEKEPEIVISSMDSKLLK